MVPQQSEISVGSVQYNPLVGFGYPFYPQPRESAMRSCAGLMHSRKKKWRWGFPFSGTCAVNSLFGPVQQGYCCCCIYFPAYKLYTLCLVEDCRRHYELDTNIRRPSFCQQTKKNLWGLMLVSQSQRRHEKLHQYL